MAKTSQSGSSDLRPFEEKIYSQNGEDGIIREIFKRIGTDTKTAVEFGVEDGSECNTRLLKDEGWEVLQMDGGADNPASVKREFITAENINYLFKKHHVREDLDLLSIDIDSNDFWVWRELDPKYRPRLVIMEYNATVPPDQAKSIKYDRAAVWDGVSDYWGASLLALYNLSQRKGYDLVYCSAAGINAFFVRHDLINKKLPAKTVAEAYRPYGHTLPKPAKRQMIAITDDMYQPAGRSQSQDLFWQMHYTVWRTTTLAKDKLRKGRRQTH